MQLAARKLLAAFTAFFVLQCSVYCACGADAASVAPSCHETSNHEGAVKFSPPTNCPHHKDQEDAHSSDSPMRKTPCHRSDEHQGSGCSHCSPSLTAQLIQPLKVVDLPNWIGIIELHSTCQLSHVSVAPRQFFADRPPSQPTSTLLSLHCALTV